MKITSGDLHFVTDRQTDGQTTEWWQ